jgi:predicted kinase
MHQVFIQMSGVPGSGKTTIASALARRVHAITIDHDITKSALLDADVPVSVAGLASYNVLNAVARHLLSQGYSVIFDSPCLYTELLERGQRLAQEAGAQYLYIECVVEDLDEIDRRLRERVRTRSQLGGVYSPPTEGSGKAQSGVEVFQDWMRNMKRPKSAYLVLDTTRPPEICVEEAVRYIERAREDRQRDHL